MSIEGYQFSPVRCCDGLLHRSNLLVQILQVSRVILTLRQQQFGVGVFRRLKFLSIGTGLSIRPILEVRQRQRQIVDAVLLRLFQQVRLRLAVHPAQLNLRLDVLGLGHSPFGLAHRQLIRGMGSVGRRNRLQVGQHRVFHILRAGRHFPKRR